MSANGRLSPAELVSVSGTLLTPRTAEAFVRMLAACKRATGVALDVVNGGGGYRDLTYQRAMYAARALYLPIRIAEPGTSTHGLGTALDLTTTCWTNSVRDWCRANARHYGFAFPPAIDPRHFLHLGTTTGPAGTGDTTPIPADPVAPPRPKEHHMAPVIHATNGAIVQLFEGKEPYAFSFPELSIAYAAAKAFNGTQALIEVSNEEMTVLIAQNVNRARMVQAIPPVDTDALAAALAPLITADENNDDGPAIAAAIVAALKPDFAAIPGAVNDDAAARMAQ